jgi:hypothetical protein
MRLHDLLIPLALVAFAGAASAQTATPQSFPVCESQQELEQVLASDGQFMPDGCRTWSVTSLESEYGPLCVVDFEAAADPRLLDRLTDAALPSQWWVLCENLATGR